MWLGRSDIALSDSGRLAVRQLANLFTAAGAATHWYCSPLQRTRETALLLRTTVAQTVNHSALQLPELLIDERLVELDFGVWEGMTWDKVHEQHETAMQTWGEDWVNRSPPEGETFAAQVQRCRSWLTDAERTARSTVDSSAVVITHGGSIRALVCQCLQWPLTRAMSFRVDPATVTVLQRDNEESAWCLRSLNARQG